MRLRRYLTVLVGLVGLLVFVAGCGKEPVRVGGKPRQKMYKVVVSLSPSTTEIFASFVDATRLRGKTASCNWPPFINEAPIVMSGTKPNYEKIRAIAPDLIIYDKDLFSDADLAKIKELGIETKEFKARTVDEFIRELYEIGKMGGTETRTSEYVDNIYKARQEALTQAPKIKPRVMMVLPSDTGDYMVAGTDSFQADLVRAIGCEPVGPKSSKFEPANAEAIIAWNPQVVFVAGPGGGSAGASPGDPNPKPLDSSVAVKFAQDGRMAPIDAVKQGHVAAVPADMMTRRGSRVDRFLKAIAAFVENNWKPGSAPSNGAQ